MPLSINCWPSVSGGESYVNIEYEATGAFDLQNVVVAIPLPALASAPRVNQVPAWPPCGPPKPAMLSRALRRSYLALNPCTAQKAPVLGRAPTLALFD